MAVVTLLARRAGPRVRDAEAGAVCAGPVCRAALLAGPRAAAARVALGAGQLATGLAVGAVYGVLAVLTGCRAAAVVPVPRGVLALGALSAAVVLLAGVHPIAVAGFAAAVATALAARPMISLRLARLPLPRVPADMDSFRADEKPTMGQAVLDQTSIAERLLTGTARRAGSGVAGSVVCCCTRVPRRGRPGSRARSAWCGCAGRVLFRCAARWCCRRGLLC